jgi:hypothetical protein
MKSLILHQEEVIQLSETGSVTVVRPVKPQPDLVSVDGIPVKYKTLTVVREKTIEKISYPDGEPTQHFCDIIVCPFGQPGEVRFCKETWGIAFMEVTPWDYAANIGYKADGTLLPLKKENTDRISLTSRLDVGYHSPDVWRSSSTMPQWASRFNVECTGVKVEQINGVWSWLSTYKRVG